MSLFADLYLDEDVSALLAKLLRSRGFNVVTARDQDMLGRSDAEQLAKAVALHRAIVSHNRRDFEELHIAYLQAGQTHAGIIVATRRDVYELARRLATLLNTLTADEITNQLLYV